MIIHSDRGSQFKSKEFIYYTDKLEIVRSMCSAGASHEIPVAERINGILKNELLVKNRFKNIEEAKCKVYYAIVIYNKRRPHLSCNMLIPYKAHQQDQLPLQNRWRQRKKRVKLEVSTKIRTKEEVETNISN